MEVLSSRVLYRAADLHAPRRFYEETLGLHVYRERGEVLGVVFFIGGGFLEITSGPRSSPPITLWRQVREAHGKRLVSALPAWRW